MSYRGEGDVYGTNLVRSKPRARVAVLYENTELGRDMLIYRYDNREWVKASALLYARG